MPRHTADNKCTTVVDFTRKRIDVAQPFNIHAYNNGMGGVDRMDQNISKYRVQPGFNTGQIVPTKIELWCGINRAERITSLTTVIPGLARPEKSKRPSAHRVNIQYNGATRISLNPTKTAGASSREETYITIPLIIKKMSTPASPISNVSSGLYKFGQGFLM